MSNLTNSINTLVCISDVLKGTNMGRSKLYLEIQRGFFTKPVKTGSSSAWPISELTILIAARTAGKTDDEMRHIVDRLHEQRIERLNKLLAEANV